MKTRLYHGHHSANSLRPYAVKQDTGDAKITAALETVIEHDYLGHMEAMQLHDAGTLPAGEIDVPEHRRELVTYMVLHIQRPKSARVSLRMKEIDRRPLLAVFELEDEERQRKP